MRETKFRAWTGTYMDYRVTVGAFGAFYVQGIDPKDSASLSPFNTKYSEQTPIMQYIGRKDKNGKEIYEGDIVNWRGARGTGNYGKNVIVSWNEKSCGFGFKSKYGFAKLAKSGFATFSTAVEVEVVGNIYENPKLLEKI